MKLQAPLKLEPLPASPLGARLCQTFSYTWSAILKVNDPDAHWETLTKFPLKPRVLWRFFQDSQYVVGVRFDDTTAYALIDIDRHSPYHPQQSRDGIQQIQAALETMGLCRTFCTRSSWSQGIHLWVPLATSVPSFWLATGLKGCLESHGLSVKQGELETFPNCKAYAKPGDFSNYQGHRLPLQPATGAVLLNEDMEAVPGGLSEFFAQWDWAATGQDLALLKEAMGLAKTLRSHRRYRSGSAVVAEWRRDLETEIAEGWTGRGQTNHLLKTIACYGVVFQSLDGERLEAYVLDTVEKLPGYFQWCQHQTEIKARVHAWAKMAAGYYWALGTQGTRSLKYSDAPSNDVVPFNGNDKRAAEARNRIQAAVATLRAAHSLPDGVRGRMDTLVATAKCSNQTLQKAKELWHPDYLNPNSQPQNNFTATTEGSVCSSDRADDRGEKAALEPKPSKRSKADQYRLLHTFGKLMKGCTAVGLPALKTQNPPAAVLISTEEEKELAVAPQPVAQSAALTCPQTDATTAKPDPSTTPMTGSSQTTGSIEDTGPVTQKRPTSGQPSQPTQPKGNGQPSEHGQTERHKTREHRARHSNRQGQQALTGLESLLPSLPPQTQATVPDAKGRTPSKHSPETQLRLPSDPPPPEAGTTPDDRVPPRDQRVKPKRQPKSGIDPQALPPFATYIAPPLAPPAISPSALVATTTAIGELFKRLSDEYQWTTDTIVEWLAQHFDGRRRSQIKDIELPLVLEKLQAYWQQRQGGSEGEPHAGTH